MKLSVRLASLSALIGVLAVISPAHGSEVTTVIDQARELSHAGQHRAVIALLQRTVLADSSDSSSTEVLQALELVGVSHELLEEEEAAADAFTRRWVRIVGELGSDTLPAVREAQRIAIVLTRAGHFEDSRAFWELCVSAAQRGEITSYLDLADVSYGIARTHTGQGHFEAARHWFTRALEESRAKSMQRAIVQLEYAKVLDQLGEVDEAQEMRRRAEEIRSQAEFGAGD